MGIPHEKTTLAFTADSDGCYEISIEDFRSYFDISLGANDIVIEVKAGGIRDVPGEDTATAYIHFPESTPLKASIGDFVWEDLDNDGIQDAWENGISGVTVKLYDCAGSLVVTTTTNTNGLYLFSGLTPGEYYVEFILPTGYSFSPQDQGSNDAIDSDADTITGMTICTTLTSGENELTWDAGMKRGASLGDLVWEDLDNDGIQDAWENGISGVTVKLYDCAGSLVDTTTTNTNGLYLFSGLTPGEYYVEFILPTGYSFSPQDQGSNDAIDSDADTITGMTICTTLTSGENDLTWDAGMYQQNPCVQIKKYVNDYDADDCPGINVTSGSTLDYKYIVKNCGNTYLRDLKVTDDKLGYIGAIHLLAPGDYHTLYKTTPAQLSVENTGTVGVTCIPGLQILNIGTVEGTPADDTDLHDPLPGFNNVTDDDSACVTIDKSCCR